MHGDYNERVRPSSRELPADPSASRAQHRRGVAACSMRRAGRPITAAPNIIPLKSTRMNALPRLDPTHNRLEKAAFVTLQLAAVALIMFTIYDGFRFALAPEQP